MPPKKTQKTGKRGPPPGKGGRPTLRSKAAKKPGQQTLTDLFKATAPPPPPPARAPPVAPPRDEEKVAEDLPPEPPERQAPTSLVAQVTRLAIASNDASPAATGQTGGRAGRAQPPPARSPPGDSEDEVLGEPQVAEAPPNETTLAFMIRKRDELQRMTGWKNGANNQSVLGGPWPDFALVLAGAPDTLSVFKDVPVLTRGHFCVGRIVFWVPERQFPRFYPEGRPRCPFHGHFNCVEHKGMRPCPRRFIDESSTSYIWGAQYSCTRRLADGVKPHYFTSYASNVMALAPKMVLNHWLQFGAHVTHRSAVAYRVVHRLRGALVTGQGASGFLKTLAELHKAQHLRTAASWRSYVDFCRASPSVAGMPAREPFYEFASKEYGGFIPSLAWMLKVFIDDVELRRDFHVRQLQMVDGLVLSGDHSHKVAKLVYVSAQSSAQSSAHTQAFEGLYTLMNGYGQVVGFWFVHGTTLQELEPMLRGVARRFKMYGFPGPLIFTTDRCCDERKFWVGDNSVSPPKTAIFESLARRGIVTLDESDAAEGVLRLLKLKPDADHVLTDRRDMTMTLVDKIYRKINASDPDDKVMSVDCEWKIGSDRAHLVQIGLLDGSTYLFHLRLSGLPHALKLLLEDPAIAKVGNRIHNDVRMLKPYDCTLGPTIDLSPFARDRGKAETRVSALDDLVRTILGAVLPKDATIRMSDWSKKLNEAQTKYAALDAYASIAVFDHLRRCVVPTETPVPKLSDLPPDTRVVVYSRGLARHVADGIVVGGTDDFGGNGVRLRVVVADVLVPGAKQLLSDATLLSATAGLQPSATFELRWNRNNIRVPILEVANPVAVEEPLPPAATGQTGGRAGRAQPEPDPMALDDEDEVEDARAVPDEDVPSDDDDGDEEDHLDCLLGHGHDDGDDWRRETIKQDILHIFLRHQKLLSKEHGAFKVFMSRLRDLLFVPNPDDMALIKACLKKRGLSDDDITDKINNEYAFFVRRVRRAVPGPDALIRDYDELVKLFANVKDAKTGAVLFRKKAWDLYKVTRDKHMKKGCLSDMPGLSYYIQAGEDKVGMPLFRCIRGTNAVEGFHQKIRQLIRGFSVSPRYALCLLHEYIYRWNVDLAISVRGLPEKFGGHYDHHLIEEEQEAMESWNLSPEEDPYKGWVSSSAFESTGEWFGLPREALRTKPDATDEGLDAALATIATESASGGDLDEDGERVIDGAAASLESLPASARWFCQQLGMSRPPLRVTTEEEVRFFDDHYLSFTDRRVGTSADSHSFIDFSRMADFWNKQCAEEDAGSRSRTSLTPKNSSLLMAHWKKVCANSNQRLTLRPVAQQSKALRVRIRDPSRATNDVDHFPAATRPATVVPPHREQQDPMVVQAVPAAAAEPAARPLEGVTGTRDVPTQAGEVPTVQQQAPQRALVAPLIGAPARPPAPPDESETVAAKKKRPRANRRCRRCGQEADAEQWIRYHDFTASRNEAKAKEKHPGAGNLMGNQAEPHEVCKTPARYILEGFPLADGAVFPRRSRAKQK